MKQDFRLEDIGLVNRNKEIKFKFNGKEYFGYEGDTLASALLANGVHLIGRSFKYHRPRGFFGAGVDEPNAKMQVVINGHSEPNINAICGCIRWLITILPVAGDCRIVC